MRNRVAWSLLCLGVLVGLAYLILSAGPLESVVYLVVAGIGVAMSVIGACLVRGSRRRVWVIMAVGQVLYLAGDVLWVIYEQILDIAPYPSVADAFYLSRYPLLMVGVMWLIRGDAAAGTVQPSSTPQSSVPGSR